MHFLSLFSYDVNHWPIRNCLLYPHIPYMATQYSIKWRQDVIKPLVSTTPTLVKGEKMPTFALTGIIKCDSKKSSNWCVLLWLKGILNLCWPQGPLPGVILRKGANYWGNSCNVACNLMLETCMHFLIHCL